MAYLKSAYLDYKRDTDAIMENVLCTTLEDEDRYRVIIERLISSKKVAKYDTFTH